MNSKQKKALYESIMRQVSKTVKKTLNEMSPEVYRNAADRREAQINALPTYLKNKLGVNRNAPRDLRAHADKIQAKLDAERKAEEERMRIQQECEEREHKAYLASIREATKEKFGTRIFPIIEILTLITENNRHIADFDYDEALLKTNFIASLKEIDDVDYFRDNFTEQDYQCYDWSIFDDDELEVLIYDIIPEIIQNNFTYIDLLSSIYNDDEYYIYCDNSDYTSEIFDDASCASIINTAKGNMIYVKDNDLFGHVITFKDLKKKYILSGDFRGERDEVSDYADDEVVAIYNFGDYALFSNNKRKLNKIEQELWDNHTMACGGIEKI